MDGMKCSEATKSMWSYGRMRPRNCMYVDSYEYGFVVLCDV